MHTLSPSVMCGPMDCPDASVPGISQARILEWAAISFSRDLPQPGIKPESPRSLVLASGSFTSVLPGRQRGQGRSLKNIFIYFSLTIKETRLKHLGKESHNHQPILIQGEVCRCVTTWHISSDGRAANCPTDRRDPRGGPLYALSSRTNRTLPSSRGEGEQGWGVRSSRQTFLNGKDRGHGRDRSVEVRT